MPAPRELGVNVLGDVSPQAPGSRRQLACQEGVCWDAALCPLPSLTPALSPLPSCGTGLALPTAWPPWLSHMEKLCFPT